MVELSSLFYDSVDKTTAVLTHSLGHVNSLSVVGVVLDSLPRPGLGLGLGAGAGLLLSLSSGVLGVGPLLAGCIWGESWCLLGSSVARGFEGGVGLVFPFPEPSPPFPSLDGF